MWIMLGFGALVVLLLIGFSRVMMILGVVIVIAVVSCTVSFNRWQSGCAAHRGEPAYAAYHNCETAETAR